MPSAHRVSSSGSVVAGVLLPYIHTYIKSSTKSCLDSMRFYGPSDLLRGRGNVEWSWHMQSKTDGNCRLNRDLALRSRTRKAFVRGGCQPSSASLASFAYRDTRRCRVPAGR
jgi:hypothetical protein